MTPPSPAHASAVPEAPEISGASPVVPAEASGGGSMGIKPMTPPKLNFAQRQALPLGTPGTADYDRNLLAREADQNANPWGTAENHPGVLGKIAHGLAKAGNIAGDILAPSTMALIPGTELNRRAAYGENQRNLAGAEQRETAEEAVRQRPEIAEMTGDAYKSILEWDK